MHHSASRWLFVGIALYGSLACSSSPATQPAVAGAGQGANGGAEVTDPSSGGAGAVGGCSGNASTCSAPAGGGGMNATAGSPNGGTAGATMRSLSPTDAVKEMNVGWNLGNTMDAYPGDETAWGNPVTTQAMIDAVKAAGFNTVRIPVTWKDHLGPAPDYTIDATWLARVDEVVHYVLSDGMYAIVNTHHDEWVSLMPDADQTAVSDELSKLWTQIATRFQAADEHLVFETLNEPRTTDATEWTGGTPAARAILNRYNAAAVKAIRDTGGNNAQRFIMIPTHGASSLSECIDDLVLPDDPNLIVSLHTYYPWAFAGDPMGTADFGSAADLAAMNSELDRIVSLTIAKGHAVVLGEWGSLDKANTAARVTQASAYVAAARKRGFALVWWDNNVTGSAAGFGLLNRKTLGWYFPEVRDAIMSGAAGAP